jgi:methylated-DNA-[protein]-cysteine S-methyltransferase
MNVGSLRTPVGRLSVAVTEVGLAGVRWGAPAPDSGDPRVVAPVLEQLDAYFRGELQRRASQLQQQVPGTLHSTVDYGSTVTYGELAARTGVPARAVGAVMASNPIPVVVPCHRVLSRGGLGGYSGGTGLPVKRWLLTVEGVLLPFPS